MTKRSQVNAGDVESGEAPLPKPRIALDAGKDPNGYANQELVEEIQSPGRNQAPVEQTTYEQMTALSDLVSRNLRTPLRHIVGFAELLRTDAQPPLSEGSLTYLAKVSDSACRMERLIDALQTFSLLAHAEIRKTDVNLAQLIQEVVSEFQTKTKDRNISWKIGLFPTVHGDRALLRNVLVNLIGNAVKFTAQSAETRIEIGCDSGESGETAVFIRDNGVGFNPHHEHKLFGIFQRLHGEHEFEGTGIGLANVRSIIHRHGGRTWAEGVVDGGATFYFSIANQAGPVYCKEQFPSGA